MTAVYIGLSVGAVVAEAIPRGQDIPPDRIVRTRPLADKSWTELVLDEEVEVAVLRWPAEHHQARPGRLSDGVHVAGLRADPPNRDRHLDPHDRRAGLHNECRHECNELALMLVDG
ncbi:hypothetical protein [Rhodococcus sp. LB1]|uniref:hypothetical protein n=1 Tax=Rhodococcus sp. LB1 TaxID=1807499 RepID=UPI00077A4593|nr:hypothetical protein [Rhodococcus sp. LB1]